MSLPVGLRAQEVEVVGFEPTKSGTLDLQSSRVDRLHTLPESKPVRFELTTF